ncbi:hypothetical protein HAX54_036638, partial [Datura stramonium]|nr:hypothetical protein [Datura stramonium]
MPAMNRAKGIEDRTPPPSYVPSNTLERQFKKLGFHHHTSYLAQTSINGPSLHESHVMKLA